MFHCLQTSSISQTAHKLVHALTPLSFYSSSDRVELPMDHRAFHEHYESRHASAGYTY